MKPVGERLSIGSSPAQPGGHTLLAARAVAHARALGLRSVKQSRSRCANSASNYVSALDDLGRKWVLRISEHHSGRYATAVHFDLVSRDGVSGGEWLEDSLALIVTGSKTWFETEKTGKQRARKHRGRIISEINGKKLS
jgi:hypothetical protein